MRASEANAKWAGMTPAQQRRAAVRHYNGTCICYGPRDAVRPGSRETGKDCLVACMSSPYRDEADRITRGR